MKTTEVVTRTTTSTQIVAVICDLCGAVGDHGYWAREQYEVAETTVSIKRGNRYPEGHAITVTEFDICPRCFEERLVAWLRQAGAEPRVQEDFDL